MVRFLREFLRGVAWTWRRARGSDPVRVGPLDHTFEISILGSNGKNDIHMCGSCTKEGAHRLVGFLAVHEEPAVGVCARYDTVVTLNSRMTVSGSRANLSLAASDLRNSAAVVVDANAAKEAKETYS